MINWLTMSIIKSSVYNVTMAKNIFSFLTRFGFDVSIIFQSMDKTGKIMNFKLSHVDFDGTSGLIYLLKQNYDNLSKLKTSSLKKETVQDLSIYKKTKIIIKILWQETFMPRRNTYLSKSKISEEIIKFFYFEKDELQVLINEANKLGINLNTLILKKINDFLMPYTKNKNFSAHWMMPVSLYNEISYDTDKGNNSSFINVEVNPSGSHKEIFDSIKTKIEKREYIKAVVMERFLLSLPDSFCYLFIKSHIKSSQRIGCFSNLGKWSIKNLDKDVKWGFSAPISSNQPFSCSVLTLNGNFCISFRVFKHLGIAESDLDRLKKIILNDN